MTRPLMIARLLLAPMLFAPVAIAQPQPEDPLPPGAAARLGSLRWRADGAIVSAAMPDAKTAVTVTDDLVAQVWDLESGRELRRFSMMGVANGAGGAMPVRLSRSLVSRYLSASGNGKRIACLGDDRIVSVWDVATGKELMKVAGGRGMDMIVGVSMSADGETLATSSISNGTRIHKVSAPGETVQVGEKVNGQDVAARSTNHLSGDGKMLLQVTADRGGASRRPIIAIFDAVTGKETKRIASLPFPPNRFVSADSILVCPQARTLALLMGSSIVLVDVADGQETGRIDNSNLDPRFVYRFSPDGKSLIGCAGPNEQLVVWEVPTGKIRPQVSKPFNRGTLASRLDGLVTLPPGGKSMLWCAGPAMSHIDLETGKVLNDGIGHPGSVKDAFFTADGKEVLTRSSDSFVRRWDARSGKLVDRLDSPAGVFHAQPSPDGKTFAAVAMTGVRLFNAGSLKETHTLVNEPRLPYWSMAFSPDSKSVALVSRMSRKVQVFAVATGERLAQMQLDGAPADENDPQTMVDAARRLLRLIFSPRGDRLAITSERLVTLWDLTRGRQIAQIPLGDETLLHAALSPDDRTIALETTEGTSVWELATMSKRFAAHRNPPTRPNRLTPHRSSLSFLEEPAAPQPLAFSPDGRLLARAGQDRKARLFDAWTGKEVAAFEGHRGSLESVAFSLDGQRLVSASADTTALVWDLASLRGGLKSNPVLLSEAQVESAWRSLIEHDGAKAFDAIRRLADDPVKAVALLRALIEPAAGPDAKALEKLIAELGHAQFSVREKANQELSRLGAGAAPALRQAAAAHESAEVRKSAKQLLDIVGTASLSRDQLRAVRAVEVLERAATPDALALLKNLAGGANESSRRRKPAPRCSASGHENDAELPAGFGEA